MQKNRISKFSNRPPPVTCVLLEQGSALTDKFIADYGEQDGLEIVVEHVFKKEKCPLTIIVRTPDGVLHPLAVFDKAALVNAMREVFGFVGPNRSKWIIACSRPVYLAAIAELKVDAYRYVEAV
jgi:hypothetical protein